MFVSEPAKDVTLQYTGGEDGVGDGERDGDTGDSVGLGDDVLVTVTVDESDCDIVGVGEVVPVSDAVKLGVPLGDLLDVRDAVEVFDGEVVGDTVGVAESRTQERSVASPARPSPTGAALKLNAPLYTAMAVFTNEDPPPPPEYVVEP